LVWFITVGMALFFSLDRVAEGEFCRQAARRAVAVTVFVEGFANLKVFGLAIELVLWPSLAVVGMLAAFSEGKEQYAPVRRVVNRLLAIVGMCILGYVSWRLASDFDAGHTLRALAPPVWLTIGCLPFIYMCGLVTEYRQAFARIERHTEKPVEPSASEVRAATSCSREGVRAGRVRRTLDLGPRLCRVLSRCSGRHASVAGDLAL
jgi:hypothetical protein